MGGVAFCACVRVVSRAVSFYDMSVVRSGGHVASRVILCQVMRRACHVKSCVVSVISHVAYQAGKL